MKFLRPGPFVCKYCDIRSLRQHVLFCSTIKPCYRMNTQESILLLKTTYVPLLSGIECLTFHERALTKFAHEMIMLTIIEIMNVR